MSDITDTDNYKFLSGLVNSPQAKAQQAEYPDAPMKTVVGTIENGNDGETEGFLVAQKPRMFDKTSPLMRDALLTTRTLAPSAQYAALGALMGGVPSGGIGAGAGALMGLGAKSAYDMAAGLVVNPLSMAFRGKELLPSTNAFSDKMLDKLGVPYPETRGEEIAQNLLRAGVDAFGGGPALGKIIADASQAGTVARGVGTVLQEAPAMQMLGGMSGQAAVEAIDPEGRSPTLDTFASLAGGMLPFLARGVPHALYGKREMTPAYQEAMRRALDARSLEVSNSSIEMTPRQVEGFIRDAESSNSLSAGIRGFTQGRGLLEPMQNYSAVRNAEKNILENVLNPSEAVENINRVQAGNFDQEFPGFMPKSDAASNDAGVVAALSPSNANPRVVNRSISNTGALSQASQDMASTGVRPEGAFNEAAAQRQSQFLDQPMRAVTDTGTQVAEQQRLLREIQAQKAATEAELAALRQQLTEYASAENRGIPSKAGNEQFWQKTGALNEYMEAAKLPSELDTVIPTTPIVEGIQQSKAGSATALERPNPLIAETEQQLRRFGVEPTTTGEAPTMNKTVIAAQPLAAEGASVPFSSSAMTPARAAQIEAGIAAMPEPKGPVKYLGGSTPVESVTKTPSGQFIKVRRKIVEFDDVARSGSEAHPAEYQNRNRAEITSENQVNDIYGKFNPPEITGSQPSAGTGAPIVGPQKNVLEGGHGRMMVLERVLKSPEGAAKRAAYIEELKRAGHDVSGFKNPVEVQERVTPLTPAQIEAYVADMNQSTVAQLSTGDMARADSKRILAGAVAKLDPTKPLESPANAEFVRSMNSGLGATELQPYIRGDGGPNSALVKRYQDGLNQAAYGDRSAAQGKQSSADVVLRAMRDDVDPMIKSIASAMDDASGGFAKLRMMIESGQLDGNYDLGQKVAEAAAFVRDAKKARTHPIKMLNDQAGLPGMGGPDPITRSIIELFYNESSQRQVGTKALGETLTKMASDALEQKVDLFGGGSLRTPEELIQMAKQNLRSSADAAEAAASAAAQAAPENAATAPSGAGAKKAGKKASTQVMPEQASMMKEADAAPAADPDLATGSIDTEAVSVMSAPPEQFTVRNAVAKLDSLRAQMRAAEQTGGVEWANAKRDIQPVIDQLESQVKTYAPTLWESKQVYAQLAEAYKHGNAAEILRAGQGGDPHNVHPTKVFDLWFDKAPSEKDAVQFAVLFGDTPQGIEGVRQYAISHLADAVGEGATGAQIRAWKNKRNYIFEQPEFKAIGEEIREMANRIDSRSTTSKQIDLDFAAENQRLTERKSARTAAESNLERQRGISEETGSMRITRGGAGIDQVLANPDMAREAVAAASTPAARVDLENQIRAHINEKIRNSGVNADRPVGEGPITAEDLNISMAKTVRSLLENRGSRQSLEILTSPEHVRRLDMLANALESEAKPSKMMRGSAQGSDTQQKTGVDRFAQASSSYYRRITQTALDVLKNTNVARQFAADIQLNPELLKQIVLMHKANDPSQIKGLIRTWAKNNGRIAGPAAQLDRGWRKRDQARDQEEESENQ